jgi:hypothetical protein
MRRFLQSILAPSRRDKSEIQRDAKRIRLLER